MRALFKNAGKYDRLTSQYPIERLALSAEWWRLFRTVLVLVASRSWTSYGRPCVPHVSACLVLRRRSCQGTSEAGGCPTPEASTRQQGLRADPALLR